MSLGLAMYPHEKLEATFLNVNKQETFNPPVRKNLMTEHRPTSVGIL